MTTLEVLMKARAEVEKGWVKNTRYGPNGETCLVGALHRHAGVPMGPQMIEACEPLTVALGTTNAFDLITFNNDPETTKADVLALYDRAIASLVPVGDSSHVFATVA